MKNNKYLSYLCEVEAYLDCLHRKRKQKKCKDKKDECPCKNIFDILKCRD